MVGVVFLVIKVLFWTIFLPFRLLFKLLWIPVGLAMGAVGLAPAPPSCRFSSSSAWPWLSSGAIAALLALLVPAIPFILLGFVIWAIVKSNRPAAAA